MTAVALTARTARFRPARALRLEVKHSPVVWALPVLAAVFYFNAYRTAAGFPPNLSPLGNVRTMHLGEKLFFVRAGIW